MQQAGLTQPSHNGNSTNPSPEHLGKPCFLLKKCPCLASLCSGGLHLKQWFMVSQRVKVHRALTVYDPISESVPPPLR